MVGASRATLYYYFSGREDLLAFLLAAHVDQGAEQMAAAVAPAAPAHVRLRSVVKAIVGYLGAHPGMCAGLLSALGAAGRMNTALEANDARIARPLRDLLIEGRDRGAFTFESPADAANAILGSALMAVLGRAAARQDPTDPTFVEALTDQIVRGVSVP